MEVVLDSDYGAKKTFPLMNATLIAIMGTYHNPDVARLKCDSHLLGQNTCQYKLKDEKLGKSLIPDNLKATSKSKYSYVDREDDRKSLISERCIKKYSSGGSKVEVSLVNAELWKILCEIENEMRIRYRTQ